MVIQGKFRLLCLLTVLAVWLTFSTVRADTTSVASPDFHPVLDVRPAGGTIEIDGDLTDPGWTNAARAEGFVEVNPGDNLPPAVRSAALVTYTESHLYIAMIAWDDPHQVRASMSDRDAIFRDDYFGIMLDTYGDYAWGYEIFVNPFGIQGDLRISSNGMEDESLDLVFESRGIVTDSGYQVELAIPFASLRFPERPEQTWRMNFWRDRQRENRFRYSWTAQDRDNDCYVCQWGTLTGIKDVKPGSSLDILPNILSHQSGSMAHASQPDSRFESEDPDAELSLNARYGLSTNASLELTLNPDFSQVESDAGQIDVNETHALFFNERRPFFQEGSDLYGAPFNIIYTRTINDPIIASKFTGQFGRFSLAYLLARDEHSPLIVPLRERSETISLGKSTVNILRGRQTFGQDSYVGFVITDRRTDKGQRVDTLYELLNDSIYARSIDTVRYKAGSGTAFGLDGRIRLNQSTKFEFMTVGSHTVEPDGSRALEPFGGGLLRTDEMFDYGSKTVELDGESYSGQAVMAAFSRGGRYWDMALEYRGLSPTFRPDNGWIYGNDRQEIGLSNAVTFRPNRTWLVEWGPRLEIGRMYTHRATVSLNPATFRNGIRDEWFIPEIYIGSKNQTEFEVRYIASREWHDGKTFTGISIGEVELYTTPAGWLQLSGSFEYGKRVSRQEMVLGIMTNYAFYGTIRPTSRLRIDPSFESQKLNHRDNYMIGNPDAPRAIFSVSIFRTRINYQFSREWFLRLVVECGDNNETQDPNYLTVEPLLTYRINPFTLFYVGASWGGKHFDSDYEFERETTLADGAIELHRDRLDDPVWRLERAQLFAKFQYLFRL
jgi:hypothetical protein